MARNFAPTPAYFENKNMHLPNEDVGHHRSYNKGIKEKRAWKLATWANCC
jgi:hypothetical protein